MYTNETNHLIPPIKVDQLHTDTKPISFTIEETTSDVYKLSAHDPYTLYALKDIGEWYLGDIPYAKPADQKYFVGARIVAGSIQYTLNGYYNNIIVELCSYTYPSEAIENLNRLVLQSTDEYLYNQIHKCCTSYLCSEISLFDLVVQCLKLFKCDEVCINDLIEYKNKSNIKNVYEFIEGTITTLEVYYKSRNEYPLTLKIFKDLYTAVINVQPWHINDIPLPEVIDKLVSSIMLIYTNTH